MKKKTSAGYRRKRNKTESEILRRADNLFNLWTSSRSSYKKLMTFSGYFFRQGQPKSLITKSRRTNAFQNPDFEAIYLFSVNIYHTSAVVNLFLSNPALSCSIFSKIERNRVYSTKEDEPTLCRVTLDKTIIHLSQWAIESCCECIITITPKIQWNTPWLFRWSTSVTSKS